MKIKSAIIVFLIIICIISGMSMVSASEIQDDAMGAIDDYQSNIKLNQENGFDSISKNNYVEENLESDDENVLSQGEEPLSFNQFGADLNSSGSEFNMTHDYACADDDDPESCSFNIENLTINGNNHVLDGSASIFCFDFHPGDDESVDNVNLVINDLTIKNFRAPPLDFDVNSLTLNNVNFTDCIDDSSLLFGSMNYFALTVNNCNFYSNSLKGFFSFSYTQITINNSYFSGKNILGSALMLDRVQMIVENSTFEDFNAQHGGIINFKGDYFSIRNSKFLNSNANATGGAIIAKFFPLHKKIGDGKIPYYTSDSLIENCLFSNLSSTSNGGAIHLDLDSGTERVRPTLIVSDSNFTDCRSKFGGAISIIGGILNISSSSFTNNAAGFEGGAIYSSWTNVNITESNFFSNKASKNAGAIYFDKGNLLINGSTFMNNKVSMESNKTANAIYAHDVKATLSHSTFDNGGVGVYADFADDSVVVNVEKNNDIFLMDNHDYLVSVETPGIKLNLKGNEIVVDTLPSRFDARDWGWVTPGKTQGDNDDCWAFATVASLETALLKATGIQYNLSQNYVQKLQLKYFNAGDLRNSLTGFTYSGLGYALSWYGALPVDGVYDDRGMISDTDLDVERIHVQDAMIIYTGQDDTVDNLKRAIMKYGAVTVQFFVNSTGIEIPTEGEDIAIMEHGTHFISLIGWNDKYMDEGDEESYFMWFTKDSLTEFSNVGYSTFSDIDYYAIAPQRAAVAYIFENTNDYHVNYQTDFTGLAGFDGKYNIYSNEFTSKYSEVIGAVGTYFNDSGIKYSLEIYVNNESVHNQTGVSEFAGFRTIVLDKYVPVKEGDQFKVVFASNSVPYQAWSRMHYMPGRSLASADGETWTDFAGLNKTVCLKAYTLKVDENSFAKLAEEINKSGEVLNITHDYLFNESTDTHILGKKSEWDTQIQIKVNKDKLVINGNNHVIDGAGIGASFIIPKTAKEIVINDLTFKNFNKTAFQSDAKITLNNVNFTGFKVSIYPIFSSSHSVATLNNCTFHSNQVSKLISGEYSDVTINNSRLIGNDLILKAIDINRGHLTIHNSLIENFTCKNKTMIDYKGDRFELVNSTFANSITDLSGGAILAKYFPIEKDEGVYIPTDAILIKDCLFTNLTAGNDGGAIHIDLDSASRHVRKTMNIINTNFTDCSARFGGAISVLGGDLNITGSNFINNAASFAGGAVYTSWTNVNITGSNFTNNRANRNAGALYFDKGKLNVTKSNFTENEALGNSSTYANAVYAHDVLAYISDSTFDNGGVGVYMDFADNSKLVNVEKNDDIFLMDNHNYILSVETPGIKLNFTNNETIVDKLPSQFDARDWGWTTPAKTQGDNDDCWAFATVAAIETALLKKTGVAYDLSQNYVQEMQLKYYPIGDIRISLTGFVYSGLGHALSWYGILPKDSPYDDRGMIIDADMDTERIHVQDAVFIYTGMNDTIDNIKRAVLKYGAVMVQLIVENETEVIETEGEDIALMVHHTHFGTIIGWKDTNESDGGMWIVKDSLSGFAKYPYDNFSYIDYFAIDPQRMAVAFIFENNIDYHVNYQTDLTALAGFNTNYTMYSNEFTSKYTEVIGAVGTYFNESGIEYSFDIYVNGAKVHTQKGVSEFAGFRTIVLDKYVPVKEGDQFKVVFTSNSVPYQAWSRMHYMPGRSLASADGETWTDFAGISKTVCLKAYTLKVDENSFAALAEDISKSGEVFNITHDYLFNESTDQYILSQKIDNNITLTVIKVDKDKLVINGNNHVIDGAGKGAMISFSNSEGEIVINNVTFKNFNKSVLLSDAKITLNNVNFTDCIAPKDTLISTSFANVTLNNCNFHSNQARQLIYSSFSNLVVNNSRIIGNDLVQLAIEVNRGQFAIHNSIFENFTCQNKTPIDFKGDRFELVNSTFSNSLTGLSGGLILAKYFPLKGAGSEVIPSAPILIKDCLFNNITSGSDGGVIHIDLDSASHGVKQTVNIINSNFTDCSARFGGAISTLGGNLNITGSNFINNAADFAGGAIYSSWTNVNITGSNFTNNRANRNAGALYFDKGKLNITKSNFTENEALGNSSNYANAIYAHDVLAYISDSAFDNGGVGVYMDFADNSKLVNVEKNNDVFLMDNHDYILSVETPGIKLNFKNNEIIVDALPSRFDARDWGWTTPGKIQGDNDDCWAFATVASIETALLKRTGVAYNLSQNYVQKMQLKYYPTGDIRISLTGFAYSGLGYALSWYGVLPMDSAYDDRGMILDADADIERIHVQDALFIYTGMNDTIDNIKRAIMKYGAVTVQAYVEPPEEKIPTEGDDIAIMEHDTHFISLIGWQDRNDSTGGFWITKDSVLGFGDKSYTNFPQIDYYAINPQRMAIAYIFENNINYHVNYQTDLTALAGFDANYTMYSNEFTSKYDELIGAVGTYFNESGIDYSFDVFVNGKKVHTQTGVSEFAGFRTIVLNKYIPIKTGDQFKVVFKSNSVPYQGWSRVHYLNGTSLVSIDGNSWVDFAPLNKTVCLKVYTVADDTKIVNNKNINVDYNGGSYFSVKVVTADGRAVGAGEVVKFTINGKTLTAVTDNDGIAKIKISEKPGKYSITTSYRGVNYKNTVTVKHVLTVTKVSVKNTDKKLILKATLKINGKAVKGKTVKFTFKGKTYKAKTNAKGVASVTIKQAVVKKLTKKSYAVKATYLKDTVKGTVTVKQVLKAYKATVKKSSKKFYLKASLKINGKAAKKKVIKFKFKGKTYKAKTNKKGIAKVTIKKKVIKKLKKGKKYSVKVTYLKDTIKTTVKVK